MNSWASCGNERIAYFFMIRLYIKDDCFIDGLTLYKKWSDSNYESVQCFTELEDSSVHFPTASPFLYISNKGDTNLPLFELTKNWYHPKFKLNIYNFLSKISNIELRCIKLI